MYLNMKGLSKKEIDAQLRNGPLNRKILPITLSTFSNTGFRQKVRSRPIVKIVKLGHELTPTKSLHRFLEFLHQQLLILI